MTGNHTGRSELNNRAIEVAQEAVAGLAGFPRQAGGEEALGERGQDPEHLSQGNTADARCG